MTYYVNRFMLLVYTQYAPILDNAGVYMKCHNTVCWTTLQNCHGISSCLDSPTCMVINISGNKHKMIPMVNIKHIIFNKCMHVLIS